MNAPIATPLALFNAQLGMARLPVPATLGPKLVSTVYLSGETRRGREWECEFTVTYRFNGEQVTEIDSIIPDFGTCDINEHVLSDMVADALIDDCTAVEAYEEWLADQEDARADAAEDDRMVREWEA